MRFDVVGMDGPCVDLAVNVETFPEPNGGQRVNNISWQGGGKVATGLVAAARLGAVAAIIGTVGTDLYGRFSEADFKRHGIDTEHLIRREGESTHFSVVVSDRRTGGRSILYYPGTEESLTEEELPLEYLRNTSLFFLASMDETAVKAASIAKEAGAGILMDADFESPKLMEHLPLIDHFIGSEFLYNSLFETGSYEENCRKLSEKGPGVVVFTLGDKGCVGVCREGYFEIPAYRVEVVDTVGAGDVFHGAFAAGLQKGWPIAEVARFACAVSAVKCTRIGGRAGIPDEKTVTCFMETGRIDYAEIDRRVEFYQRGLENL